MSSLIFCTDAEQVLVVTDTLAVNPDGTPFLFTSKAHYLPHLRTIIAGTGAGGFSGDWYIRVNNRMVLKGIENLDFHTPDALRAMWSEYKREYSVAAKLTTTIYHFGFSEVTGQVHAYAYRSTRDFVSERLSYGIGVKPECTVREGNLLEHVPAMMEEQRRLQASKPLPEQVFIGGEAIGMHLTKDACTIFRLFEFGDYSAQLRAVFNGYAQHEC